jgi:hypothetical protein
MRRIRLLGTKLMCKDQVSEDLLSTFCSDFNHVNNR